MSQVREIKCPHCGEWTMWAGKVDDRCLYCDGFLEPQRFSREVEKKVNLELLKENDYLFIKPSDGPFIRWIKKSLNSLRWVAFTLEILFFCFITVLLVLISFMAV